MEILERFGDINDIKRNLTDLALIGIGTGAGLVGGTELGKFIENNLVDPVTDQSTTAEKITAWAANNLPKLIAAYAVSQIDLGRGDEIDKVRDGMVCGFAGDIVLDTYQRMRNDGVPLTTAMKLSNNDKTRIQSLLRENAQLKSKIQQLNKKRSITVSPSSTPARQLPASGREVKLQPANRPLERRYQFVEGQVPGVVSEKKPIHKKYQFVGNQNLSVTSPEVLSKGFGFIGLE